MRKVLDPMWILCLSDTKLLSLNQNIQYESEEVKWRSLLTCGILAGFRRQWRFLDVPDVLLIGVYV